MNILAIEPLGAKGHRNWNTLFLKALGEVGTVTLATFAEHQEWYEVEKRLAIPDRLYTADSGLSSRISQIRAMSYILQHAEMSKFDWVIFLCYEEISFFLRWPAKYRTLVVDHNNIDKVSRSRLKRLIFRWIDKRVSHMVHMETAAQYIRDLTGRMVHTIPHPYYRSVEADGEKAHSSTSKVPRRPFTIFSPSAGPSLGYLETLVRFVKDHKGYYLVGKSTSDQNASCYELRIFFEDYEERMGQCDAVFFGGRYDYRTSGVVFEAMSYGKPCLILDCLFARELHKKYPNMILPMRNISAVLSITFNHEAIFHEQQQFLREHAYEQICLQLSEIL